MRQIDIRKLEDSIRQAEQAGRAAQMVGMVRQLIIEGIRSDQFRHFIATTHSRDNQVWPIATITPDRLNFTGLPDNARVVRLDSQGVTRGKRHRNRYCNFIDRDWMAIQEVIDHGESKRVNEFKSVLFNETSDGQAWVVFINRVNGVDGVFLQSAFPPANGWVWINEQSWYRHGN